MPKSVSIDAAPKFEERGFRFGDLGIAPENPRVNEPADDGIPQIGETIAAAGIVERLLVRPGRRGEKAAMIINGRRRYLGADFLFQAGRIDEDFILPCSVAMNKAAELAAMLLPTEQVPVHIADVIVAVGRLRKAKLETAAIAKALGYEELDIRRMMALSCLHAKAIAALRQGRITLKQAKLIARLKDPKEQAAIAEQAMIYGISEHNLRNKLNGGRVALSDPRVAFVGQDRYAAAGGRTESDLFGEFPDVLLDPEILEAQWQARVEPAVEGLKAQGVAVFVAPHRWPRAPDGYDSLTHMQRPQLDEAQSAALDEAEAAAEAAEAALAGVDLKSEEAPERAAALATARLAMARAIFPHRSIGAAVLYPCANEGIDIDLAATPAPEESEDDEEDAPDDTIEAPRSEIERVEVEIDLEGRSHILHETYTDVATRGLIRDLADSPAAALTALIAQLFKLVGLRRFAYAGESALTIKASRYERGGHPPIEALDGEVIARIASRREAYLASGLRPIPWVDSLSHGEKMALMAELVAMTLDLREPRTSNVHPIARAEAAEIAELAGFDIGAHWSPDEAFLKVHGKKQLLGLLEAMGADDAQAKTLKKDDLVLFTQEQAAERGWAPEALAWRLATPEPEGEAGAEPSADEAHSGGASVEAPADLAA